MSHFTELIPTLKTDTPAEGRELAIMIARKTIATLQPDAAVRSALRPEYESDSGLLMAAGHIVAIEFATISAANDHWR